MKVSIRHRVRLWEINNGDGDQLLCFVILLIHDLASTHAVVAPRAKAHCHSDICSLSTNHALLQAIILPPNSDTVTCWISSCLYFLHHLVAGCSWHRLALSEKSISGKLVTEWVNHISLLVFSHTEYQYSFSGCWTLDALVTTSLPGVHCLTRL